MKPPNPTATLPREVEQVDPPTARSVFLFYTLPEHLQSHQLPDLLRHLAQAIEQVEAYSSASELRHFVQWALQQSYSKHLTPVERMALLNQAWRVQKLLWCPFCPEPPAVPVSTGDPSD